MANDSTGSRRREPYRTRSRDDSHEDPTDHARERHGAVRTESRRDVVDREKNEHGGIKIGSAFFGWLTATGMSVLLAAVVAAAGTAVGLATDTKTSDVTSTASSSGQASTIGLVGGIALLVILFLSYYCGGYVAARMARMARFNGSKQGLAVWLWAILITIVVAIVGDSRVEVRRALPAQQLPQDPGQRWDLEHHRDHRPGRDRGGDPRRRPARWSRGHALPPQGRQDRARPLTLGGATRTPGVNKTVVRLRHARAEGPVRRPQPRPTPERLATLRADRRLSAPTLKF